MDSERDALRAEITIAAHAARIELTPEQVGILAHHVAMVYDSGRTMNLTAVPIEEAPALHVLDSLNGVALMERGPEGPWADLGSGAGFPGIPLSVAAGRHVDLIEATRKKASFLETVKAELRLDVAIRGIRAEEAAQATPCLYSAVAARAVGSLPELVELAAPLLAMGGVLVAWKGPGGDSEKERGNRAGDLVGVTLEHVQRYSLPGQDGDRYLFMFRKVRAATLELPRRVGMAHRRPLA